MKTLSVNPYECGYRDGFFGDKGLSGYNLYHHLLNKYKVTYFELPEVIRSEYRMGRIDAIRERMDNV